MSLVHPFVLAALSRRRLLRLTAGTAAATVAAGRAGLVGATTPNAVTAENGAFLDAGFVHEITIAFDQGAYDAMVATYSNNGEKEWIEATITIDGSTYERAGMRLKGNSSLGGVGGGRIRTMGPGGEEGPPTEGGDHGTPVAEPEQSGEHGFVDRPDEGADFDAPERLPWLIRLDKFVDGQRHDGFKELVIRSNRSQTSLNEAVALDLIAEAGLASQLAAYAGFSVNGSDPVLRLVVEHPNDEWMALRFSADGLLYKGESTGDYSYRGDDPDSYKEVFDLEAGGTGDNAADMKPLIEFLDFINNSDDPTFTNEIERRVDVEQFAVYLATMDLIGNFDDIDGPGNNGYLYVDPASGQFTVVPWDMNLAFGGGGIGPESGGWVDGEPPELPHDADPAFGSNGSVAATPVAGEGRYVLIGGPDGRPAKPNPLVERITAIEDYSTLIDEQATRLRADLYKSGRANDVLSRWGEVLKTGAGTMVEQDTITSESEAIAEQFSQSSS